VTREHVRMVPVVTCRIVQEQRVRREVYCVPRQESYVVTQRIARPVCRVVQQQMCRMVPRQVSRQVPYEICTMVPVQSCQPATNCCGVPGGNAPAPVTMPDEPMQAAKPLPRPAPVPVNASNSTEQKAGPSA
jgi:hypothetical protein